MIQPSLVCRSPQFGNEISLNNILLFGTVSHLSHVQVQHCSEFFVFKMASKNQGCQQAGINKLYLTVISTTLLLIK